MAKKVQERELKLAKLASLNINEVESSGVDYNEYTNDSNNKNDIIGHNEKNENPYQVTVNEKLKVVYEEVENENKENGKEKEKVEKEAEKVENEEEVEWDCELVKAALQIIGNLSYGCKAVQVISLIFCFYFDDSFMYLFT